MVVTFPLVLLLLDAWPLSRIKFLGEPPTLILRTSGRLIIEKLPLLFLSILVSALTYEAQMEVGGFDFSTAKLSLPLRIGNALISYWRYLAETVWPFSLAAFYPHPIMWPSTFVVASLAGLIVVSYFAVRHFDQRPHFTVGWFWFCGTLIPVIGFVQAGSQAIADRYTYLPLVGVFILAVWSIPTSGSSRLFSKILSITVAIMLLGFLALVSHYQVRTWKSEKTLWSQAAAKTKSNYLAEQMIGLRHLYRNDLAIARMHLMLSEQNHPRVESIFLDLGRCEFSAAKYKRAIVYFSAAAQAGYIDAEFGWGYALAALDNVQGALPHLRRALVGNSRNIPALVTLANIYSLHPDKILRNGALAHKLAFEACRLSEFKDPFALETLANALAERQYFNKAVQVMNRSLWIALKRNQIELIDDLRRRLALYKAERTYYELPSETIFRREKQRNERLKQHKA
jgi:hypothetical protein